MGLVSHLRKMTLWTFGVYFCLPHRHFQVNHLRDFRFLISLHGVITRPHLKLMTGAIPAENLGMPQNTRRNSNFPLCFLLSSIWFFPRMYQPDDTFSQIFFVVFFTGRAKWSLKKGWSSFFTPDRKDSKNWVVRVALPLEVLMF